MTAEVIVMNKQGVALAADSAGTISTAWGPTKICNTSNKLFRLSKNNDVGILTFNMSELNGIPFELLVKQYRQKSSFEYWETLEECETSFFNYLKENPIQKSENEKYFIESTISQTLSNINIAIKKAVDALSINATIADANNAVQNVINTIKTFYAKASNTDNLDNTFHIKIDSEYKNIITRTLHSSIISPHRFPSCVTPFIQDIYQICIQSIYKITPNRPFMGIAIAGYGNSDIFPACFVYHIYGSLLGEVLYEKKSSSKISLENQASITPLAQKETVFSFVNGIDNQTKTDLYEFSLKIPQAISGLLNKKLGSTHLSTTLSHPQFQAAINDVSTFISKMLQREISQHESVNATSIINNTVLLSISDLAQMAKSLVEITSLKKKISLEMETVGGPTDVAVISKGDGFIWIERKHYFKKELNENFFSEHYQK